MSQAASDPKAACDFVPCAKPQAALLPIFLNTVRLQTVVVGGGRVGQRKSRMLLAAGAAVRVVALEPAPHDLRGDRLEWLAEQYRPDHLDGAKLVYTAAPADVCKQVHADAQARGLLVCRADDAAAGDFVTPATLCRGARLKIAVSTGGVAPALARRIRDQLATVFDDKFGEWLDLLESWRHRALAVSWEPADGCHKFLDRISDWSWLDRFRKEGGKAIDLAYQQLARDLGLIEFRV